MQLHDDAALQEAVCLRMIRTNEKIGRKLSSSVGQPMELTRNAP